MLTDRSYLVGVVGSAVLTAPRDAVDEIPVNVLRPSGRVPTIKPSRGNGISPLACRGRRLAAALRRPSPGSSLRNQDQAPLSQTAKTTATPAASTAVARYHASSD